MMDEESQVEKSKGRRSKSRGVETGESLSPGGRKAHVCPEQCIREWVVVVGLWE